MLRLAEALSAGNSLDCFFYATARVPLQNVIHLQQHRLNPLHVAAELLVLGRNL